MDFTNRNSQPQSVNSNGQPMAPINPIKNSKKLNDNKTFKIVSGILLASVILLIIALVTLIGFDSNNHSENKYVNPTKLQAVFLNTGQVYFGNIKALNNKYLVLQNIFYLQTTSTATGTTPQTAANSRVTLVKLGCELHAPYDQMIINNSQVTFWENLKPTGQVAKAVAAYEKANPNGQVCTNQSSAAPTNSSSNFQGTPNNSNTSAPANASIRSNATTSRP